MTAQLPPLDAHAHIEPDIPPRDLVNLGAVIFAVSRSPAEWRQTHARRDLATAWGLGCHPSVPEAIESFDETTFAREAGEAAFLGEVGLDGRSKVPMVEQERVLSAILAVASSNPIIMSIHSVSATRRVIALLDRYPVTGAVLHWWRGTPAETEYALGLGCYFSLNGAEAMRPKVLDLIPRDRILTETDFPFSRRTDRDAVRPGITTTIEAALADAWELAASDAREQVWRNFQRLMSETGGEQRLPRGIQRQLVLLGDDPEQPGAHGG